MISNNSDYMVRDKDTVLISSIRELVAYLYHSPYTHCK